MSGIDESNFENYENKMFNYYAVLKIQQYYSQKLSNVQCHMDDDDGIYDCTYENNKKEENRKLLAPANKNATDDDYINIWYGSESYVLTVDVIEDGDINATLIRNEKKNKEVLL